MPSTEVSKVQPQTAGPKLVVAGAHAGWLRDGKLEIWDLARHAKINDVEMPDRAVAIAAHDAKILAVANDPDKHRARLVEVVSDGGAVEVPAEYASSFANAQRLVATDLLYVGAPGAVTAYKIAAKVELVYTAKVHAVDTLTADDGGPVVVDGDAIVRLGLGDKRTPFAREFSPTHLAAGPRKDTLWATTSDELLLVELKAGKATVTARAKLAASPYHLANAGGNAAVITVAAKAGAWQTVTLAVYGSDAKLRWSAPIATPKSVVGWVAGSASHVAVAFGDELHAWSADGKSLF